jgi:hypothetical protein
MPSTSPLASPSATPLATDAASLTVTGSGEFCGPWWYGCGAVLVVAPAGWTLPDDWAPSDRDTRFEVDVAIDGSLARVTGVAQIGQDRIEPGVYRFVVVETESPDDEPQGTLYPSIGCSVEATVPPGTQAVTVAVEFRAGPCRISVSSDAPPGDRSPASS